MYQLDEDTMYLLDTLAIYYDVGILAITAFLAIIYLLISVPLIKQARQVDFNICALAMIPGIHILLWVIVFFKRRTIEAKREKQRQERLDKLKKSIE